MNSERPRERGREKRERKREREERAQEREREKKREERQKSGLENGRRLTADVDEVSVESLAAAEALEGELCVGEDPGDEVLAGPHVEEALVEAVLDGRVLAQAALLLLLAFCSSLEEVTDPRLRIPWPSAIGRPLPQATNWWDPSKSRSEAKSNTSVR